MGAVDTHQSTAPPPDATPQQSADHPPLPSTPLPSPLNPPAWRTDDMEDGKHWLLGVGLACQRIGRNTGGGRDQDERSQSLHLKRDKLKHSYQRKK